MHERIKIPVKQGYGLTELFQLETIADLRTSPTTHAQEWGHWKSHIGSIGKLAPNMEAMIVDEDGNEVDPGNDGELWMRGPNIFRGYLNNEEATRNSITPDGWFKSGDVAYVTPEGHVIIIFCAN
jgi:long-subunit acyl-CoA synthetase (AMP-forming)